METLQHLAAVSYLRCTKMKVSIEETADLVTFTEEILNEKIQFLYSVTDQ